MRIKVYDNGGKTYDRYTVLFAEEGERVVNGREYNCVGASSNPFHPQGFYQHSTAVAGPHLGRVIAIRSLPTDVQTAIAKERA